MVGANLTQVKITYHVLTVRGLLLCKPPNLKSGKIKEGTKQLHEAVPWEKFVALSKSRWNDLCPICKEKVDRAVVVSAEVPSFDSEGKLKEEPIGLARPGNELRQKEINRRLLGFIRKLCLFLWNKNWVDAVSEEEMNKLQEMIDNE